MAVIRDNATYKPSEIKRASVSSNNPNLMANVGKQIEALNYGGGETDSLIIKVDNENNIITGDVKWQAFLGESDSTAYPGNKGADNHNKILELFDAIGSEIRRAQSAESVIQNRLDSEITERIDTYRAILKKLYEVEEYVNSELRYEIKTLNDRIDSTLTSIESNRNLINSVNRELKKSIADETKRAVDSETSIAERVEEVKSDLESTINQNHTILSNSVEELDASVRDLTDRMTTDIITLKSELKTDYSIKIQDLSDTVSDLQKETQNADNDLYSKISSEESIRKSEDARLSTLFNNNLSSVKSDIDELESNLTEKISLNAIQIEAVRKESTSLSGSTDTAIAKLEGRISDVDSRIAAEEQSRKVNDNRIESLVIDKTNYLENAISDVVSDADKNYASIMSDVVAVRDKVAILSSDTNSSITSIESDIGKLNDKIDSEINSRASKDNELSAAISGMSSALTDRLDAVESSINETNGANAIRFNSVDSRLSTIDRSLSSSVSTFESLLSNLSQKIDKEISDRIKSDTQISDTTKNEFNDTIEYIDSSIESAIKGAKFDNESLKLEMSNLLQSEVLKVEESITLLEGNVDELDTKFTTDISLLQRQYDNAISNIAIAKNESMSYTDEQISIVNKSTNELVYDTQQALFSDIKASSDKLQESIRATNAAIDLVSVRLLEEVSNRMKADADTLTSTKAIVDGLHTYVSEKMKEVSNYVDKSVKSAVEKLDAFDVLLLNNIDAERVRAGNEEIRLDNQIRKEILDRVSEDALIRNEISISSGNSESRLLSVRNELMGIISSETNRATSEEEKLYESIDTLRNEISTDFVKRAADGVKETTRVYSDYNGETTLMVAGISPVADTLVKRDEEGRVILLNDRTDINKLNDANAAPKLYVDMMVDNLRDDISDKLSSIVFIDGGKAPVPKT